MVVPIIVSKIGSKGKGVMGPDPISELANFLGHTKLAGRSRNITDLRNTYEQKDRFLIVIPAVGVSKKDVSLEVKDDSLHVKVKPDLTILSRDTVAGDDEDYDPLKVDFYAGEVEGEFQLNGLVDVKGIEANVNLGLLVITLPKKAEKKARKIKID